MSAAQFNKSGIAHLRLVQTQFVERRQPSDVNEPGIGHLRSIESKFSESRQRFKVNQPGIGRIRSVEKCRTSRVVNGSTYTSEPYLSSDSLASIIDTLRGCSSPNLVRKSSITVVEVLSA